MPTVTSEEIVNHIMQNCGKYESDPVVIAIYKYETEANAKAWALCCTLDDIGRACASPHLKNAELIYTAPPSLFFSEDVWATYDWEAGKKQAMCGL